MKWEARAGGEENKLRVCVQRSCSGEALHAQHQGHCRAAHLQAHAEDLAVGAVDIDGLADAHKGRGDKGQRPVADELAFAVKANETDDLRGVVVSHGVEDATLNVHSGEVLLVDGGRKERRGESKLFL